MSRLFTFLCLSLLFNLAQAQLPTPEYKKGQAILSVFAELRLCVVVRYVLFVLVDAAFLELVGTDACNRIQ